MDSLLAAPWSLLATGVGLFLTCVVGYCLYNITLHPLARYPGPLIARLTDWVDVYQTSTGDRHLDQLRWHEKYGSVVRIAPNTLSFNTLSAVKGIYTNRQGNVQKSQWYAIIEASAGEDNSIHAEIDRIRHGHRRRPMEHAFTDKSLRSFEAQLVKNIDTFRDIILKYTKGEKKWSNPLNMSEWSTYLNYDIMGDLVFGREFHCMTSEEHRFVPSLLMNGTAFIYTFASMPFRAITRCVLKSGVLSLPIIGGEMARDEKRFFEYAATVLDERVANEEKTYQESGDAPRMDIMHHLLHATDSRTGKGYSRVQLAADASLLIAAGADTTSLTLAAAFFHLLHNPRTLELLLKEVRAEDLEQMSSTKVLSMPYLRAVVDETLRLSPPVPSILPREVLKGGIVVDETWIPAGTVVGVPAFAIHRNAEYYPQPETFYPERWIANDDDDGQPSSFPSTLPDVPRTRHAVSVARQAFCPFSQGSRGCVGRQLAYYELHTALALLLYRFDIRLAMDPQTQKPAKDSTSWRQGLMPVTDPKEQNEAWRPERKREDEFQLFDRFISDRNGPMVEFKDRL